MLRMIGMVLILMSGTLLGFYQAWLLAARPRQIRELILALRRLETEVQYGYTPLPDALRAIARGLSAPLSRITDSAASLLEQSSGSTAESWQLAAQRCWGRTAMKQPELDAWLQLGPTIGSTDRAEQIKHLKLAVTQLQAEEQAAAEDRRRYENMWKSLGVWARC